MEIDRKNIEMIKENYPAFDIRSGDDEYVIVGEIFLNHVYKEVRMTGKFIIEIVVSNKFPIVIPIVREISNGIAANYPHKNIDGELCLASEIELKMFFAQSSDICLFLEKYIIPYLYTYCYYEEYGVYPYGERSHGMQGNLEYLKDLLEVDDWGQVFDIMMFVIQSSYRGHLECPCGSGERIRNCHGTVLKQLMNANVKDDFIKIMYQIKRMYDRKGKNGKHN